MTPTATTTSTTTSTSAPAPADRWRGEPGHGREAATPAASDDLSGLVASLGRWYWEVLQGDRDPRQLRRMLTPACERRVLRAARTQHHLRRHQGVDRQRVLGVRCAAARWTGDVCEGVALVTRDGRTTAVVVVIERRGQRLRVIDLAQPEGQAHQLPRP